MLKIKLTNTLTRKEEFFTPQQPNHVKIYVCGITPYDYSHLGHGRCYVNFDVLVRLFKFLGYNVNYVRNFTDIDDKILKKAEEQGDINLYPKIAKKFIEAYHLDMKALGNIKPDHEPRVTQYIPQIIKFVEGLIEKGKAYVIDSDVYFDISKYAEYGKLSGRELDEQKSGARIEVDQRKHNPEDFALWKGNADGQFWKSPWGFGRPGWHIECSVMAQELLGQTIDIHGGGMDLIFPHHENEIAQSEGLHEQPFARYWLHNAFITINKEKMSKSLGNFVTLKDIFKIFDPMVLRYFFLQHNYRTPIDFSDEELKASQVAYKKLVNLLGIKALSPESSNKENTQAISTGDILKNPLAQKIITALCDDLNTPKALGLIFENLAEIKEDDQTRLAVQAIVQNILGLDLYPIHEDQTIVTPEIQLLIEQREQARKDKNWALADQIRDQLKNLGYDAKDKKLGA
ncbi:MAG: cysteine--tRNA ligase [Candidatus Babeliales bacterium]|jgi:cysteinyl-tRNA synthetase